MAYRIAERLPEQENFNLSAQIVLEQHVHIAEQR
jgi:hypothetical protein